MKAQKFWKWKNQSEEEPSAERVLEFYGTIAEESWYDDDITPEEFKADLEKDFHFEWNIVDVDESHIYVTNKTNRHRYHISVICPAALYVDVYRILEDGTECKAF